METVQITPEQQLKMETQKNKVLTALHKFDGSTRFTDTAFLNETGMFTLSVGVRTDILNVLNVVRNKLHFKVLDFHITPTFDGIVHLEFIVLKSK